MLNCNDAIRIGRVCEDNDARNTGDQFVYQHKPLAFQFSCLGREPRHVSVRLGEAGNETYSGAAADIGNVPGNQGLKTESTTSASKTKSGSKK